MLVFWGDELTKSWTKKAEVFRSSLEMNHHSHTMFCWVHVNTFGKFFFLENKTGLGLVVTFIFPTHKIGRAHV